MTMTRSGKIYYLNRSCSLQSDGNYSIRFC
ncbi:unnamed protein product [Spirodela intermedia]|uniref:Uncharacterized protein n=1 Tax=Spirodela intermedia TaxID=51605 RepID=A0A7I8JZR5_SPIIN|nr:unnamed protein product [Spirodela intermedia]